MNFEYDCTDRSDALRRENRLRDLVASALWLCGFASSNASVDSVLDDLRGRYGDDADKQIVSALNEEYLTAFFKRKLEEKNREAFADELAARVWATVKGMTWYTDGQKVVPDDLAERVARKAKDEASDLERIRSELSRGW